MKVGALCSVVEVYGVSNVLASCIIRVMFTHCPDDSGSRHL
jgi:hypothetical protein